jgi:hypothetical protein
MVFAVAVFARRIDGHTGGESLRSLREVDGILSLQALLDDGVHTRSHFQVAPQNDLESGAIHGRIYHQGSGHSPS